MKLQDNQKMLIKAEIKITQKDIDFLFNGSNEVKQPTQDQVIEKAIEHLNNTRYANYVEVEVVEHKHAEPVMVLTDGKPDIEASILAAR